MVVVGAAVVVVIGARVVEVLGSEVVVESDELGAVVVVVDDVGVGQFLLQVRDDLFADASWAGPYRTRAANTMRRTTLRAFMTILWVELTQLSSAEKACLSRFSGSAPCERTKPHETAQLFWSSARGACRAPASDQRA